MYASSRLATALICFAALGLYARPILAQLTNDNCANAAFVGSGAFAFDNSAATTDGPQETCAGGMFQGTKDLWYRINAIGAGMVTVDTCGSSFDTTLTVYSGLCGSLGPAITCNDDSSTGPCFGTLQSFLQFHANAGASYLIRLGGFNNGAGPGVLHIAGPLAGSPSAFTYQGRLTSGGGAVTAPIDFTFKLFDLPQGGSQFGSTFTEPGVSVANGLFNVVLDFGQAALSSAPMYLEITANGVLLSPRQLISAAPFAASVPWSGVTGIPSNVTSAFSPWVNAGGGSVFLNNLAGRVALGRTDTPNAMLEIVAPNLVDGIRVVMTNTAGGGSGFRIRNTATTSRDAALRQTSDSGGARLVAQNDSTGFTSNPSFLGNDGNWSATSDARTKKDVQPLTGLLDKVLTLRPVSFYYINQDLSLNPDRNIGFIAQEVEPLFPSVVSGRGDEIRSLSYASMSTVAIGALQELAAKTDTCLAEKDRQIAELQARLERIEAAMGNQPRP